MSLVILEMSTMEGEQNIVVCRARADQLFADAEGRVDQLLICQRRENHDILRCPFSC